MLGALVVAATAIAMIPSDNASAVQIVNNEKITIDRVIPNAKKGDRIQNCYRYTIAEHPDYINPGSVSFNTSQNPSLCYNVVPVNEDGILHQRTDYNLFYIHTEKPGDYYFTLTETGTDNSIGYPLADTSYTLLVSVRNSDGDPEKWTQTAFVLDSEGEKLNTITGNDTEIVFSQNKYATHGSVKLIAKASGSAGDLNKCFEYKVHFSDWGGGDEKYDIDWNGASSCYDNNEPTEIGEGDIIKLKHGRTATIGGMWSSSSQIPVFTTYSVEKVIDPTDLYTVDFDGTVGNQSATKTVLSSDREGYDTSNFITVTESYDQDPATGVNMKVAIYAILAITGATGFYYLARKRFANKA